MSSETTAVSAQADVELLAGLLAKGERAAFHGPPGNAVAPLERAVELAHAHGRDAEATAASWLLGVAHAASGRLGGALTLLGTVMVPLPAAVAGERTAAELRLFGALAAATAASVHRQLGRHSVAWEFDTLGLSAADTLAGLDEAVFDCRLGRACDAVGLGEAAIARTEVAVAARLVDAHRDWWRQRVRLDWLRTEVALLDGDAASAQECAAEAVDRAELSRAPRHVAKGLVLLGVAQLHTGTPDAMSTLQRAAMLAEQLGTLPLVWRSRALLGALQLDDDPASAASSLQVARSAVLAIAGDLPDDLRADWFAQPDIEALLSV